MSQLMFSQKTIQGLPESLVLKANQTTTYTKLETDAAIQTVVDSIPASSDASSLTSGTVAAARLGTGTTDSTTFLRGDNTWTTISTSAASPITWTTKTAAYTAVAGDRIFANTAGGAFAITLPITPSSGNTVIISDYASNFSIAHVAISGNGSNILGQSADLILDVTNQAVTLVYADATRGWVFGA